YHDMVCETIYMKGSKDMQRAQQYMDSKQQREEERMAWSSDRFRRQRATTKLFADMQETFGEILGKPAAPPWPKEEALVAEDFADRSDAGSSKSAPRRRHGRAPGVFSPATSQDFFKEEHGSQTPSEGSRQAPRSAAFMKRSSTAPGLLPGPFKQSSCLTGYTARSPASGSPLKMVKGKSQDVVWPGGWKPEQSPGDRGLPSQYVSAKCMPGGSAALESSEYHSCDYMSEMANLSQVASVSSAASLQPRAWNAVPAGSVSHQPPAEASAKDVYKPVAALPPVDLIAKKLPVADSPVQVAVVSPSPGGGQPAASSARSNASSAALAAEPSSQSPCVVQSPPVATALATSLSSAFAPASWPLASRPLPAGPLAPGGVAPTKVTTVAPASSASTRSSTSMPGSVAHISPPNSQDQLSKSPITDGSDADHALDTEDSAQKLIEGESDSDEAPTQ
ncbi:unnamed protein product, partial [Polarella glacialis]